MPRKKPNRLSAAQLGRTAGPDDRSHPQRGDGAVPAGLLARHGEVGGRIEIDNAVPSPPKSRACPSVVCRTTIGSSATSLPLRRVLKARSSTSGCIARWARESPALTASPTPCSSVQGGASPPQARFDPRRRRGSGRRCAASRARPPLPEPPPTVARRPGRWRAAEPDGRPCPAAGIVAYQVVEVGRRFVGTEELGHGRDGESGVVREARRDRVDWADHRVTSRRTPGGGLRQTRAQDVPVIGAGDDIRGDRHFKPDLGTPPAETSTAGGSKAAATASRDPSWQNRSVSRKRVGGSGSAVVLCSHSRARGDAAGRAGKLDPLVSRPDVHPCSARGSPERRRSTARGAAGEGRSRGRRDRITAARISFSPGSPIAGSELRPASAGPGVVETSVPRAGPSTSSSSCSKTADADLACRARSPSCSGSRRKVTVASLPTTARARPS